MNDSTQPIDEQTLLAMSEADYMNSAQRDFFRRRLEMERQTILAHIGELKGEIYRYDNSGDDVDKAAHEEELRMLFRQIDRESRLLPKVDDALRRIEMGDYGYCIETGEPIGLRRLLLRPTAERSIDAKQTQEQREPQYRKVK
ncbi:RNA polymerase-binding protein DksA [Candidatus Symbiopectobacterium sp. 'North America']|uniref:TraR/DksA C4-type zinc finger protein n=1 Tax=Candidatus Symbiopectobacterium sp. 'North America' TaxID=2794574 RepID=UPI001DE1298F|nr:TraR/DksA C4-type zinc finger protein [Candidatus Symbiopectobacterium sp. 'North America']MBG6245474.1 RNA polymerase-binding protein DksA [Candidatus Symbiopectobacterium sp. 'North America']